MKQTDLPPTISAIKRASPIPIGAKKVALCFYTGEGRGIEREIERRKSDGNRGRQLTSAASRKIVS
jgi:hypothetical protein